MSSSGSGWPAQRGRAPIAVVVATVVVAVIGIATPGFASTINVNCSTQSLQSKINSAPAGSTLLIKGNCLGNFVVDKNLTLKADPTATLDGNDAGTTLAIPNVHTVHLIGLTITGGLASLGAGINRPSGGVLTLSKVAVQFNLASGTSVAAGGGIVAGNGQLVLTKSQVVGNRAVASGSGGATALGGGIVVAGRLSLAGSTVSSNRAVAEGTSGSTAQGGGIYGTAGRLTVTASHVDANHATAISPTGTSAFGGGVLWNSGGDDALIQGSTLNGNVLTASTTAGSGGASAFGGGVNLAMDEGSVTGSTIANNRAAARSSGGNALAIGGGVNASWATGLTLEGTRVTGSRVEASGPGTGAVGGGLNISGALTVRSSTISGSRVDANSGPSSANVQGGGINVSGAFSLIRSTVDANRMTVHSDGSLALAQAAGVNSTERTTVVASTISRNTADATTPSNGPAQILGVGLHVSGSQPDKITNSTIASNVGHAEASASTGGASVQGGGLRSGANSLLLTNTTVARNLIGGVGNVTSFRGGGLDIEGGTTTLKATILALNTAPASGGPNCFGSVASQGNNVLGTTAGCTFANKPNDKLNRNPKLGALANNGGPTLTLALLTGSPALNVIAPAVCAVTTDQRGVHRPQGPKCDVGSYERKI